MIDDGDKRHRCSHEQNCAKIVDNRLWSAGIGWRRGIHVIAVEQRQRHARQSNGHQKEKHRPPANVFDDQAADAWTNEHSRVKCRCHEALRFAG